MLKTALELELVSPSLSCLPPCCSALYVCLFSPVWLVRLFPDEVLLGLKNQSLSHLCRARWGPHLQAIYRPHEHGGHKTQVVFLPVLYSEVGFSGIFRGRGCCTSFELFLHSFLPTPYIQGQSGRYYPCQLTEKE